MAKITSNCRLPKLAEQYRSDLRDSSKPQPLSESCLRPEARRHHADVDRLELFDAATTRSIANWRIRGQEAAAADEDL